MEPLILNGKYNDAKIFAKTIENELITQCMNLLNQELKELYKTDFNEFEKIEVK